MATIVAPVAASPASLAVAPWLEGGSARRQLVPLSLLHHTAGDWVRTLTFRLPWCLTTGRATSPPIIKTLPRPATQRRPATRPFPAGRSSWPMPRRCQVRPLADVQSTGVRTSSPPTGRTFSPTAVNPPPVCASACTRSPPASGAMPGPRRQERPSGDVHAASGPSASHRPWPPATISGVPPPAGPRKTVDRQVRPPSSDVRARGRAKGSAACEPTATTVRPDAAIPASEGGTSCAGAPPGPANCASASRADGEASTGPVGPEPALGRPVMTMPATATASSATQAAAPTRTVRPPRRGCGRLAREAARRARGAARPAWTATPDGGAAAGPASRGTIAGTTGIGSVRCSSASAGSHPASRCHSSPASRHALSDCCHTDRPSAPASARDVAGPRGRLPRVRRRFPGRGSVAVPGAPRVTGPPAAATHRLGGGCRARVRLVASSRQAQPAGTRGIDPAGMPAEGWCAAEGGDDTAQRPR